MVLSALASPKHNDTTSIHRLSGTASLPWPTQTTYSRCPLLAGKRTPAGHSAPIRLTYIYLSSPAAPAFHHTTVRIIRADHQPSDMLNASTSTHSSPPSPTSTTVCYFSIPAARSSFESTDDTPFASPLEPFTLPETPSDPNHPLLALRAAVTPQAERRPRKMDASKLLSLQTGAAYASRPQPQPLQHTPQMDSTSTTDSAASSDVSSLNSTFAVRCSRCHRSMSEGTDPSKSGMVSFGTNLYYCSRCASIVGYNR